MRHALAALLVVPLLSASCGGETARDAASAPTTQAQTTTAAGASAARPGRATVAVGDSDYGTILFDGRGFALYAFTRDGRGASACSGACAEAWPPYVVSSRRLAPGRGAKDDLLGTVRRADGTLQVTYDGRPLYYYVGDRERGVVLCQDVVEFGGTWLVVRASGELVGA